MLVICEHVFIYLLSLVRICARCVVVALVVVCFVVAVSYTFAVIAGVGVDDRVIVAVVRRVVLVTWCVLCVVVGVVAVVIVRVVIVVMVAAVVVIVCVVFVVSVVAVIGNFGCVICGGSCCYYC